VSRSVRVVRFIYLKPNRPARSKFRFAYAATVLEPNEKRTERVLYDVTSAYKLAAVGKSVRNERRRCRRGMFVVAGKRKFSIRTNGGGTKTNDVVAIKACIVDRWVFAVGITRRDGNNVFSRRTNGGGLSLNVSWCHDEIWLINVDGNHRVVLYANSLRERSGGVRTSGSKIDLAVLKRAADRRDRLR